MTANYTHENLTVSYTAFGNSSRETRKRLGIQALVLFLCSRGASA